MSDEKRSPESTERRNRNLRFLFLSLVIFSGIFSGMVVGVMVMIQLDARNVHPPETAQLAQLKKLLEANPENNQLRELFRNIDRSDRQYYSTRRRRMTTGAALLAGALVLLVVSARCYARVDERVPVMKPRDDGIVEDVWLTPRRRNVLAVTTVAVALALVTMMMIHIGGIKLLGGEGGSGESVFKENWPGFRGPTGIGIAPEGNWPTTWDVESGKNILWKSEVPLPGKSAPIVWGDHIFLTGASDQLQELFCYDRAGGKLLWHSPVHSAESLRWKDGDETEQVFISEYTGSAAPTPVTDGKLVYVCFNSNDVGALDFSGKVKWVCNLGKPKSVYGLASSLVLHKNILIYQCDQGNSADEKLSAIYGLDTKTGNVIWRIARPVPNSWSTPILVRTKDRVEVITAAEPWVIAYEPEYGEELWRANVLEGGEIGSSAAYANGIVYVTDDEVELVALRAGGEGNVTKTHVLWRSDVGLPDAASPICNGKFLLQADSNGTVTCFDAGSGKLFWEKELKTACWASPILAGKLVYTLERDGKSIVFELSKTYKELGTGDVGENTDVTPAFADSVIYIRTEKHLFAIGRKQAPQ